MTGPMGEGGTAVCDRGRLARLVIGMRDHARTAWWGLVAPHTSESAPLVIVQAAILRPAAAAGAAAAGPAASSPPPGAAAPPAVAVEEVLLAIRSELFGWELPGGTPNPGESLEAALVREVAEETGLVVEVEGEVGLFVRRGFRPHTAVVFRCRPIAGELAPSRETPRLRWFPAERPPEALFPWFREPLAKARRRGAPPIRVEEWQGLAAVWAALRIDLALRWRGLD